MQHEVRLRAAARAIFDACFQNQATPLDFEEAEQFRTDHYLAAVRAALRVGVAFGHSAKLTLV